MPVIDEKVNRTEVSFFYIEKLAEFLDVHASRTGRTKDLDEMGRFQEAKTGR